MHSDHDEGAASEFALSLPRRRGRFIELRPVTRRDYSFLYNLLADPAIGPRWRLRGVVPREEQLDAALWDGVLAQFLLVKPTTQDRVGLVLAYGASVPAGFAYLALVLNESATDAGIGPEATGLFAEYCFATWPLYKLYMEVPEFNLPQFSSAVGRYLHEEGRLRNHDYYGGRRWDLHILAAYREDVERWSRRHGKALSLRARPRTTATESNPNSSGVNGVRSRQLTKEKPADANLAPYR
jgi:RimJ/RimL family protein N-acetyltransferase